ncbi:hypothetical protein FNF29_07725 [Cafeteria roenbergensis]|uniref:VWFA domain-containing protein n=1 Tax=Cafeteria roenbergensis TaxID=33653 RepID=A0A5A8C116_CAFRO|nr:hypothetical protein FNF28_07839 [Cafeteria roenbergensis]KAA0146921.1 hypothetical protein FNF29_07725 [Cafeteria roenbergensis]KAA0158244.1 hypothetical protein FNF31_05478 [Cafeteria roenbergensis]|eukprot:KAA0146921.1 hypothetical protein FNF29_07725 [Cafeteria roenbergensis]
MGGKLNPEDIPFLLLFVVVVAVVVFMCDPKDRKKNRGKAVAISDRFRSLEEVQAELRRAGLESCNLIVAIDATKSNEWNGTKTFGGKPLHTFAPGGAVKAEPGLGLSNREVEAARRRAKAASGARSEEAAASGEAFPDGFPPSVLALNPYERVLGAVGRTLRAFDDDGVIPAFVFGDAETTDCSVRTLRSDGKDCVGLEGVLSAYRAEAPGWRLSGPTSYAPAIDRAVEIVRRSKGNFHVLIIVTDGQVTDEAVTQAALRRASKFPLAVVVCGVGDGPWDQLRSLDDRVAGRDFDNLQAVFWHEVEAKAAHPDAAFALAALMELPEQFKACCRLGLLGKH